MHPNQLLAHFDRISDAPDAVPRLRRFILDLAVRGKIVEQDRNDKPASQLLHQIAIERGDYLKVNKIRSSDAVAVPSNGEVPFMLPSNWVAAHLNDLSLHIHYGYTASANPELRDVRMLRITDIQKSAVNWESVPGCQIEPADVAQYELQENDLLIARTGGTIGKTYLVQGLSVRAVFASYLIRVIPSRKVSAEYIKRFLESPTYWKQLYGKSAGTGQPNVNATSLKSLVVPLPPLAEQHRIVAKVDELMALCDRLEAAQGERESRRDRLNRASLHRLNNGADAGAFRDHARFHFRHLPRLTTRPEHIRDLRETILNLAVRGKLVPQDSSDEPAVALLARLTKSREEYCRQHGVKILNSRSNANRQPTWPTPPGWIWTHLSTLFNVVTDGDHLPPPKTECGIAFLTIGNVTTGQLDFRDCRYVSQQYYDDLKAYRKPNRGDLLYTVVGATYGRPAIVETDRQFCVQRHIAILKPVGELNSMFLRSLLASPFIYEQAAKSTTGTAQPTIPLGPLREFLVPLPPLAEQHRIVAKVDELMKLCDQLESQLTTTQTESRHLLEAILHEALNPTEMVTA